MTQHLWSPTIDGVRWDALAGYDRPLTTPCIECSDCSARGEVFLFDNLDAANTLVTEPGGGMQLVDIGLWLLQHQVPTPKELAQKLRSDAERNAGNEVTTYTDDQLAVIGAE